MNRGKRKVLWGCRLSLGGRGRKKKTKGSDTTAPMVAGRSGYTVCLISCARLSATTIGNHFFRGNFAVVTQRDWRSIGRSHRAESIFHGHFIRVFHPFNDSLLYTLFYIYIYIYIYSLLIWYYHIIIVCYIWMPLMMIVGQPHATGRCH